MKIRMFMACSHDLGLGHNPATIMMDAVCGAGHDPSRTEEKPKVSIQVQAQTFDASALEAMAFNAIHQAQLLIALEPKPWRRTPKQNEAIDTFQQLAGYARRVINMQKEI